MPYNHGVPNSWNQYHGSCTDQDVMLRNHTLSDVPEILEFNIYIGDNQDSLKHLQTIPLRSGTSAGNSRALIYPESSSYMRKREFLPKLPNVKQTSMGWNSVDWRNSYEQAEPSIKKNVRFSTDTVFFERNPNSVFWKRIYERKQLRMAIRKRRQRFREKKKCGFFEALKFGFSKNFTKLNVNSPKAKSKSEQTNQMKSNRRVTSQEKGEDSLSQLLLKTFAFS